MKNIFEVPVRELSEENKCGYLEHFGIKGQKWGVRRYQNEDGSLTAEGKERYTKNDNNEELTSLSEMAKNGKVVTIGQRPTSNFTKFLAKYFPKVKENVEKDKQFDVTVDGKRIGDAEVFFESKDSLNVVWVGVDDSERGNGYASAVMNAIIKFAKTKNLKNVTLEVPGNSPDARHIYEKLGFKVTDVVSDEDDVWGGLTAMKLDIDEIKHADSKVIDPYLAHFGILGQKWGVRRYQNEDRTLTEEGKARYRKESEYDPKRNSWKSKDASKLSDEELNRRMSRLQREQQYKSLAEPTIKKETKEALRKIFIGTAIAIATATMTKKYMSILNSGEEWLKAGGAKRFLSTAARARGGYWVL